MGRTIPPNSDFNILGTTTGRVSGAHENESARPSRRASPPEKKPGRRAPPPPKPEAPWFANNDPFNQSGEPPSGGYLPNPPEYCDAPWETGPTGTPWVCMAFCATCPDRKVCEGLKGYHAAVTSKNNGITHLKEWENDDAED